MGLTNAQYQSILRGYEDVQNHNHQVMHRRKEEIYEKLPAYKELSDAVSSASVRYGRLLLGGDDTASSKLHEELARLSSQRKDLLLQNGYPVDYLEPIYQCPSCQDTGYINGTKCHCLCQKMIALCYEQSGIYNIMKEDNFSHLSFDFFVGEALNSFQKTVSLCHGFVEHFSKEYRNLFFCGTVGTGKSFLSCCIAKELIEKGHSVIYFSSLNLFETLACYSFDTKNKELLYNMYEDLYNCDLVIIDDLGSELTNAFVTSQLFACLNERHLGKKSTIISTNLSLAELSARYSDRIFSRITNNYEILPMSGQDIRVLKKRMANRK